VLLEQTVGFGGRQPVWLAQRLQQSIRRRRAERQHLLADRVGQTQVPMPFECGGSARAGTAPVACHRFRWPPSTRSPELPEPPPHSAPLAAFGSAGAAE